MSGSPSFPVRGRARFLVVGLAALFLVTGGFLSLLWLHPTDELVEDFVSQRRFEGRWTRLSEFAPASLPQTLELRAISPERSSEVDLVLTLDGTEHRGTIREVSPAAGAWTHGWIEDLEPEPELLRAPARLDGLHVDLMGWKWSRRFDSLSIWSGPIDGVEWSCWYVRDD